VHLWSFSSKWAKISSKSKASRYLIVNPRRNSRNFEKIYSNELATHNFVVCFLSFFFWYFPSLERDLHPCWEKRFATLILLRKKWVKDEKIYQYLGKDFQSWFPCDFISEKYVCKFIFNLSSIFRWKHKHETASTVLYSLNNGERSSGEQTRYKSAFHHLLSDWYLVGSKKKLSF